MVTLQFKAALPKRRAAFFFSPGFSPVLRKGLLRRAYTAIKTGCFVCLLSLQISSCSGSFPRIHELRWKLILLQEAQSTEIQETLSVAVDVTDEDGTEDLEAVAVIHDQEELYWKISHDQWEWKSFGGKKWLVCSGLQPPQRNGMPRGNYRIVVTDLAGYRAESEFSITVPAYSIRFPQVQWEEDALRLIPGSGPSLLALVSFTGVVLGTLPLKSGLNPLNVFFSSPKIRTGAKEMYVYSSSLEQDGPLWIKGPWAASEFLFPREKTEKTVEKIQ
jgi:hypothetical protein